MYHTLRRALAGVAAASFAALSVVGLGTTASATTDEPGEATAVVETAAPETPDDAGDSSGYEAEVYVSSGGGSVITGTPTRTVQAPAYRPANLAATGSDGWQMVVAGALALALAGSGLVVFARRSRQTT
jgi:LPXTG-motif cell wall-anchored protein